MKFSFSSYTKRSIKLKQSTVVRFSFKTNYFAYLTGINIDSLIKINNKYLGNALPGFKYQA